MKYVNIHGLEFKIDTTDWQNTDDAASVAEDIENQMRLWSSKDAAKYHQLLKQADNDEIEYSHPELKAVDEMCCESASKILDTYLDTSHMTGHNYSVYAG